MMNVANIKEEKFSASKALEMFLEYGDQDVIDTMEVMDVLYQFRYLRDDQDVIPSNFCLHISITDSDNSFEDMGSHFILFHNKQVIYSTNFTNIMSESDRGYEGIREVGLLELFKAMEQKINEAHLGITSEVSNDLNSNNQASQIKEVTKAEAYKIIGERTPIGLFIVKEGELFVGIDNQTGDAFVESFKEESDCQSWLNGKEKEEPKLFEILYGPTLNDTQSWRCVAKNHNAAKTHFRADIGYNSIKIQYVYEILDNDKRKQMYP